MNDDVSVSLGTIEAALSRLGQFLRFLLQSDLGDRRWPFDEAHVSTVDPVLLAVAPPNLLPWNA